MSRWTCARLRLPLAYQRPPRAVAMPRAFAGPFDLRSRRTSSYCLRNIATRRFDSGLDGADWLIEGRRKDIYHAVHRWSPCGKIHDLGRLFFAMAGSPLADVELY